MAAAAAAAVGRAPRHRTGSNRPVTRLSFSRCGTQGLLRGEKTYWGAVRAVQSCRSTLNAPCELSMFLIVLETQAASWSTINS